MDITTGKVSVASVSHVMMNHAGKVLMAQITMPHFELINLVNDMYKAKEDLTKRFTIACRFASCCTYAL